MVDEIVLIYKTVFYIKIVQSEIDGRNLILREKPTAVNPGPCWSFSEFISPVDFCCWNVKKMQILSIYCDKCLQKMRKLYF
jgi:hypothetical protein